MSNNNKKPNKGDVVIYQTSKQEVELKVRLEKETVWLAQGQIAELFGTQRPAITKHLRNIFKEKELDKISVSSILEHTAVDGKIYKTQFYNLDAIISVGYRVNSQRATQFRVWATKVLKNYLIKGYAINEQRLLEAKEKFNQLQETISFLQKKSQAKLLDGQEKEILNLLSDYSKTLSILDQYDKGELKKTKGVKTKFKLKYQDCRHIIQELKKELIIKKESSALFGNEIEHKLESIIGNLYQTFGGKELYSSLEEKAAHLLYLIIKDHPLSDGNKRVGSFLFVYFLDKNNYLYKKTGEKKINDNALTALALLVAQSDAGEKDMLVKMVMALLG